MKSLIKGSAFALLITFAIMSVWYGFEWIQFHELQWNRQCDDVVTFLYWIALTIGFSKWF